MAYILAIIGGIVLLIGTAVVGTAMNIITIPWLRLNSKVQMERDINTKTFNADNAIYNYHWFQERAGSIKALEAQIVIADKTVTDFKTDAGPREKWTFEDKTESSRLSAVAQGLKNERESQVKEYNARASEADRAIFKDELPLFFPL